MKIHARILCVSRASATSPAVYEIEYTFLVGEKRSDTVALTPSSYGSSEMLLFRLKQQLRNHLQTVYAPEVFSLSDIVIFGG